jgi:hypothetical protein
MVIGLQNYFYHLIDTRFSCETHQVAHGLSRLFCTANEPFPALLPLYLDLDKPDGHERLQFFKRKVSRIFYAWKRKLKGWS